MILRRADFKDYGYLSKLTDQEGWNYTEEDFLMFDESGCAETIVACEGGEIVGMVTLFDYGETGWISNLLVSWKWRGKGIGGKLLSKALELFKDKRTVSLFSTKEATKIYAKAGFKRDREFSFVKFWGGKRGAAEIRKNRNVLSMDRRCFGYDRGGVLKVMMKRGITLSPRRGDGFAILRPDPREPAVGPVVAEDKGAGMDLLYCGLSTLGAGTVSVLPSPNVEGVKEIYRVVRLYRGERPFTDYGKAFALAGLEFG
jgi:GNAT superfamily N-acetyltransferase